MLIFCLALLFPILPSCACCAAPRACVGLGSGVSSYFDSGYESIQRADSVVDVEFSDSGRFSSALSALSGLLAWGSDSNLSDVELKALVIKALDNMV